MYYVLPRTAWQWLNTNDLILRCKSRRRGSMVSISQVRTVDWDAILLNRRERNLPKPLSQDR